ncbi:unnamed protein product [Clonostachys solani]|uniref:DUF4440 domain-containing protein n=1 Tax=Clonostachys solani TaxID=160281 RepID=A0A9N9W4V2_9HYPO|nr:unnamed protein product [Clonostachys solani]
MPGKPGKGNIFSRNRDDAVEAQTQLWRAMCDKPQSIRKYLAEDAVVTDPSNEIYSPESEPSLDDYVEHFEPWTAYRIHDDPAFVEIDMMSSALTYRVTAWRQDKKGKMIPTEALCSTVWRQDAGGDWRCCVHHMTKI